jgi:hypothetical protein
LVLLIVLILLLLGRIWGGVEAEELRRDFQPPWFTWKGYKQSWVKCIAPNRSLWIGEISAHTEIERSRTCCGP